MSRIDFGERIRRRAAACKPASEGGAALFALYLEHTDFERCSAAREHEIVFLGELCKLVEEVDLDELSLASLEAAAARPAPSLTAARRRRTLTSRLARILRNEGIVPPAADLRAHDRVQAILAGAPDAGRAHIRRWLTERRKWVGWVTLLDETRALSELEWLIEEQQLEKGEDALALWLERIVRTVAKCDCAPVTRALAPECSRCGATPASHGGRMTPGEGRQARLMLLGRRYLGERATAAVEKAA